MHAVGIREFKTRLSEYVARARRGEHLIITDRGNEVAELAPVSEARKAVMALRESGKVRWSGGKPTGLRGHAVRGRPIADTVLEDRR